jgi:hypothetical protein
MGREAHEILSRRLPSLTRQKNSTRSRLSLAAPLPSSKPPQREKEEVLAAFAAHKTEVTTGYMAARPGQAKLKP